MLSVLINTHMLQAAREAGVERYFYSSSACVYAADKQTDTDVTALKEDDAYPAMPEDGYGWEKLFSERMCRHFREDFGLDHPGRALPQRLRPARHLGRRPREGAGRDLPQDRRGRAHRRARDRDLGRRRADPQLHVHRRLRRTAPQLIMRGDIRRADQPRQLASWSRSTSSSTSSRRSPASRCERRYKLDAPQGVRGRNSDNTLIQETYGWEPSISLADGLEAPTPGSTTRSSGRWAEAVRDSSSSTSADTPSRPS